MTEDDFRAAYYGPHEAAKNQLCRDRANGRCEGGCDRLFSGDPFAAEPYGPMTPSNHHIHYRTLGIGDISDRLCVCPDCHTRLDRERKERNAAKRLGRTANSSRDAFGPVVIQGGLAGYRQRDFTELFTPASKASAWVRIHMEEEGMDVLVSPEMLALEAARKSPRPERAVLLGDYGIEWECSDAARTTPPRHFCCHRKTGPGKGELWLVHELDFDAHHWDGWIGNQLSGDGWLKMVESREKKWDKQARASFSA